MLLSCFTARSRPSGSGFVLATLSAPTMTVTKSLNSLIVNIFLMRWFNLVLTMAILTPASARPTQNGMDGRINLCAPVHDLVGSGVEEFRKPQMQSGVGLTGQVLECRGQRKADGFSYLDARSGDFESRRKLRLKRKIRHALDDWLR